MSVDAALRLAIGNVDGEHQDSGENKNRGFQVAHENPKDGAVTSLSYTMHTRAEPMKDANAGQCGQRAGVGGLFGLKSEVIGRRFALATIQRGPATGNGRDVTQSVSISGPA
jgi:hypothetical protein